MFFLEKGEKNNLRTKILLEYVLYDDQKEEATQGFFQNVILKRMRVKRMRVHGSTCVLFIFKHLPR